jgi:hypothetical protein
MHLSTPTNVFVSAPSRPRVVIHLRAHSSGRPRATRTGSGYQNPTSNLPHRSVLSPDHLIYFLKLITTLLDCFAPLLGVNVSLIFVFSFPAIFCLKVNVWASRPE